MTDDARLWHPWLRIQRLLRAMLGTRWDGETRKQVKPEIRNALRERSKIERAGWFNCSTDRPELRSHLAWTYDSRPDDLGRLFGCSTC